MAKGSGYEALKILIDAGNITEFRQIFRHVNRTKVAEDLGIHYRLFKTMVEKVDEFALKHLFTLADLIGVDDQTVLQLVYAQHEADKKAKRKK
jgi:predicted phosphatase